MMMGPEPMISIFLMSVRLGIFFYERFNDVFDSISI